jgi:hypothetical protein
MPFSLLPESPRRLPPLAYAWIAAAILHLFLWAAKLAYAASFWILIALTGPNVSQPLPLWSWFAGPLFLLTWLVQARRGSLRARWMYATIAVLWLALLVSLPRLRTWLASGTVAAALVTLALFVLPLALAVTMIRLAADADAEARAA